MIKAVTIPLSLVLVIAASPVGWAQSSGSDAAVTEAIHRQADRITLRQTLGDARSAYARHDLATAAKLYDACWSLVVGIGPGVEEEARETRSGLAAVRLEMARAAEKKGDYRTAKIQIDDVLRVDPQNVAALELRHDNDKLLAENLHLMPSEAATSRLPEIMDDKMSTDTLIQNGKFFFEMHKIPEARQQFQMAVRKDPQNKTAYYYLNLIAEARYDEALSRRDNWSREGLVDVENAWSSSTFREALPMPNPYARNNLDFTSKGRQSIRSKLDRIRLDSVKYEGLPLSEVLNTLTDEARKRDPEKRGINFIIDPNSDAGGGAAVPGQVDPATGLPAAPAAPSEPTDVAATQIKLALNDVRLADVLDAIVRVANPPIKFSIEDYAVVFKSRGRELAPLVNRTMKVDPNTFLQGLEGVVGFPFGNVSVGSSGGGGGGGRGGGGGGGGGGQGGQGSSGITVPRVTLAGGGQAGQGGQQGGQQGGGGGIRAVTRTNNTEFVQAAVHQFFQTLGVDLTPPKSVFFNDREGTLLIHAALDDLDLIQAGVQALNVAPPQVNIKTKFVEVSQNDNRALGFDWYLGNFLMNNSAMGVQAGTAPSYAGRPSTANPEGSFPGSFLNGTAIPSAGSDSLLTTGLRNTLNAPAIGTLSGILTDPQFRVVLRALEQRDGADLLSEANVTTLSGRQTEIQVVDIQSIVTGADLSQTSTSGGGGVGGLGGGGAGAIGSQVQYNVEPLPFGPTLDVIPYVSADGFTIQMTIIPTITEFLGYDDPGAFIPQAQSISGGSSGSIPLTAQLPLPHFRLRQVTTSAIVWDGQTVVLGGLITESVTKLKDKVPILGDLPLLGRLFRSESSATKKKNLMIFVTPRIIDPSGAPAHSEDEMPFSQGAIPKQALIIQSGQ